MYFFQAPASSSPKGPCKDDDINVKRNTSHEVRKAEREVEKKKDMYTN